MKELLSIAFSTVLHLSIAWTMLQIAQYFKPPETKKIEQQVVYTLEFLPAKEDSILPLKRQATKKKEVVQKAKPKKILITQKQKSPVEVVQGHPQPPANTPSDGRLLKQQGDNRPPEYPVLDRIRKNTGRVTVLGFVNKKGQVSLAEVIESTGTQRMDSNAIKAFSSYRFEKGQEGWVKMPFDYVLDGPTKVISIRDRYQFDNLRSL